MTDGQVTAAAPSLGAVVGVDGRTSFQLFTDRADVCAVRILNEDESPRSIHPMSHRGAGHHEAALPDAGHGTLYDFLLGGERYPDPYARFLPRGVHGPAMVVENGYRWRNEPGVFRPMREQIIYEIHIGTFTSEGTYEAARLRLPELVDLGVTTLELMPLSTFPGRRGWGYDGVSHFAPYAGYGTPDQLRRLIDETHGVGLAVFLDVVYNHFGPAGNYLSAFSTSYFDSETRNAWGDGPNFALPPMRNYVLANARYWLTEFRFDGLRLDATHAIVDPSSRHILHELAEMAHAMQPRKLLIAEDERNDPAVVTALGLDGVWADDFHHVAHVMMTDEDDGYYASYRPGVDALADTIRRGWLYEGQVYPATGKPRGQSARDVPAEALIYCLQNHDQIGNRAFGDRISNEDNFEAFASLSTVWLFLPMTPLLFMGQEWAASTPFQFFTDHDEALGQLISQGRREEFKHFKAFSDPKARDRIPDPQAEETFFRCKLNWQERQGGEHARALTLYKALLKLRRTDPILRQSSRESLEVDTRAGLLIVRRIWKADDRLLLANLGDDPISAEVVAAEVGRRKLLLRSDLRDRAAGEPMPAWTAIILGAEKNS